MNGPEALHEWAEDGEALGVFIFEELDWTEHLNKQTGLNVGLQLLGHDTPRVRNGVMAASISVYHSRTIPYFATKA